MIDLNTVAAWLSDEGALGSCLGMFHDEDGLDAGVRQLQDSHGLDSNMAIQILLHAYAFSNSHHTLRYLRQSFVRTGLLNKQALRVMYLAQSTYARLAVSPFLTLDDLMHSCGDYRLETSETHFTKPEILALAEEIKDVHQHDLWLLIGKSGFYEKDVQAFSDDFLSYWFQKVLSDSYGDQIGGLLASFILWRVYRRIPNSIKSADVMKVARQISRKEPSGHGVHRCLELIGVMAAESECEDAWASFSSDAKSLLLIMIERNSSDGLSTLVHKLQLMEECVSYQLRREIILDVRQSCKRIAIEGLKHNRQTLFSGLKMPYY